MAMGKGNIDTDLGPGQAVESTTSETPHPADESSAPGPYDGLELHRPPVSSNRPDSILAHSLVDGAGAPTPDPEYRPLEDDPGTGYVGEDDNVAEVTVDQPARTRARSSSTPAKAGE